MLLDRVGGIDGDLVVGLVALLDAQVVIFEVDVEIGEDEALANPLPDDPRHFVAVDLHDGVLHLDLSHSACSAFFVRVEFGSALGKAAAMFNRLCADSTGNEQSWPQLPCSCEAGATIGLERMRTRLGRDHLMT